MGSKNAIIGDDFGVGIPETQKVEGASDEIRNAAKFSKSNEYKSLKEHLNTRIDFYQTYLPDGRPIQSIIDKDERADMWIVANAIIGEFKAVMQAYEQAAQIIEDEHAAANR